MKEDTFESFINTIKKYFDDKLNSNNEEIEIIVEKCNKNHSYIEGINNKINELKKNIDSSYQVFTPGYENKDFNVLEIDNLNNELELLNKENFKLLQNKSKLQKQNKEYNKMINYIKNYKLTSNQISDDIISKLEFCEKISLVDPHRCKNELSKIKSTLSNVSRET